MFYLPYPDTIKLHTCIRLLQIYSFELLWLNNGIRQPNVVWETLLRVSQPVPLVYVYFYDS